MAGFMGLSSGVFGGVTSMFTQPYLGAKESGVGVSMYVCMYVCVCMYVHVLIMYVCMYNTYIYNTYMYVYVCVCMYMYVCMHIV